MSDRLSALRLFVRVARTGNFSRAARELGLSQPSASRIVATLEKEIGASLFMRSTRALALTEAGAEYLARVQALIGEGVDVAFRFGPLGDSNATARRLGSVQRVLIASPAYLRRAGRPKVPADLNSHAIIGGPTAPDRWTFEKDARQVSVRIEGRVVVSANEGAVAAAVAGLGITSTGIIACRKELGNRTLLRVLPDWQMGSVDVNAVFSSGRGAKAAARALADHMLGAFRN